MNIQNRRKKQSNISEIAADFWLKYNPHRKAENMTGQLVDDSALTAKRRSTDAAIDIKRKATAQAAKACAKKAKPVLTPRKPVRESAVNLRYAKVYNYIQEQLAAGKVVTFEHFDSYPKHVVGGIIHKLRRAGHDVLTVTYDNRAIGWCLKDTLINEHTQPDALTEND